MPRLLPGRRASTAGGTVLKKQQHVAPRPQLPPPPPDKDVLHKLAVSSVPPVAHAKPTAANVVKMLGNEAARKQVETVLAKIEAAVSAHRPLLSSLTADPLLSVAIPHWRHLECRRYR